MDRAQHMKKQGARYGADEGRRVGGGDSVLVDLQEGWDRFGGADHHHLVKYFNLRLKEMENLILMHSLIKSYQHHHHLPCYHDTTQYSSPASSSAYILHKPSLPIPPSTAPVPIGIKKLLGKPLATVKSKRTRLARECRFLTESVSTDTQHRDPLVQEVGDSEVQGLIRPSSRGPLH